MNRNEFMTRLEELLGDIPAGERREALQYYEDYFNDAGVENEAQVLRELGSPEKVAAMIKKDMNPTGRDDEFTETGYRDGEISEYKTPPRTSKTLKIILVILIALAVIPTLGPILFAVLGIVIALICAGFIFFGGLVLLAVTLAVTGLVTVIGGITLLFVSAPAALMISGIGLITLAIGVVATVVTVKLCIVMYPAIFKCIVNICRKPFHGKAVS